MVSDCFDEVVAVLLPILLHSQGRLHMSIKQKARVLKPCLFNLSPRCKEPFPQFLRQWRFVLKDLSHTLVSPEYFQNVKQTERVALLHYILVDLDTLCEIYHVLVSFQLKKQVKSFGDENDTVFLI